MAKFDSIFKDIEIKKTDAHPKRITKWIHYTKLIPNKKQYRDPVQQREREEALAALIQADGEVSQDLIVRKVDVDEYEIIAGHTRCGACRILVEEEGKKQYEFLPCIVKDISEVRALFQVYSSNGYSEKTQYEKMHELEEMKHLIETYPEEFPELQNGRMVERLAKQFHMDKSTVGEYLQISKKLGDEAMELFEKGEIKKSAAVKLSSLDKKEQAQIVSDGLRSSREIEQYKKTQNVQKKSGAIKPAEQVAKTSIDKGLPKSKMDNKAIMHLINNRAKSHHGIYSEIGLVLKDVPTNDLIRYFVEVTMRGEDSLLRDFVENKIIASEIEKERS